MQVSGETHLAKQPPSPVPPHPAPRASPSRGACPPSRPWGWGPGPGESARPLQTQVGTGRGSSKLLCAAGAHPEQRQDSPAFVSASPRAPPSPIPEGAVHLLQMEDKSELFVPSVLTCKRQLHPGLASHPIPFLSGTSRQERNEKPETGLQAQIRPSKCYKKPLRAFRGQ